MRKQLIVLGASLGLMTAFTGCNKEKEPVATSEEVQIPETRTEVSGKVAAEESLAFPIDFTATVEEVHVKEGDLVNLGDVLITLDITEYQKQLEQAQTQQSLYTLESQSLDDGDYPQVAHIQQLSSNLRLKQEQLTTGSDPDRIRLESAKALAQTAKEEAEKDYESAQVLYEIGALAEKELTALEQKIQVTTNNVADFDLQIQKLTESKQLEIESLQAQIKDLSTQVGNGETQKVTGREKLDRQIQSQALGIEVMQDKLNKPYLQGNQIIAPQDGLIIHDIAAQVGAHTTSMMGPLMQAMKLESKVVIAQVPEEYCMELKIGDEVAVIPYTNQDKELKGVVTRMSNFAIDSYGENVIETTIKVEDPEGVLIIGGSVDVLF